MPDTTTRPRKSHTRPPVEEVPPTTHAAGEPERLVCNVAFCPICLAVTTARTVAPEAVDHAARAVIDVRGDDLEGKDRPGPTRLEKIEIA